MKNRSKGYTSKKNMPLLYFPFSEVRQVRKKDNL